MLFPARPLAKNIAHQALIMGHTVLFTSAGQLLGELAAIDSDTALRRRLHHYAAPNFLAIDLCGVVGYVELTQNLPIPLMI
jgi:hypothetical protein